MKNVYTTLGFALGASAALIPRDQCCFSLTASGGKSGVVGQLGDGQNRIGQTGGLANQQGKYCLNNGGLTDGSGRGCILTPPTTQFQCDVGAKPTTGFAVNSNGGLTYNGNTQFYACATGDNGGYNIYTTTTGAQTGCVAITLGTGGKCSGSGGSGSSSAPASSAPPASKPATYHVSAPPTAPASQGTPCATQLFDGCNPARSACPSGPGTFITVTPSTYPTSYVVNGQTVSITAQPSSCLPSPTGGNQGSSSQPPASQPHVSQPPAGPQTATVYSTHYQTITSCGSDVTKCPAHSNSNTVPGAHTTYACNPAHSYPGGVSCVSTNGGLTLVSPSATTPPAAHTTYACNPAHSYPGGVSCISTNGGLTLVSPSATAPASQPGNPTAASQSPASAHAPSGTSNGNGNGNACQTSLTGAYQTPHAIIPINKDQPSTSYGTQYNAQISSSHSTIFNFDIPSSYSGKQCSVVFLFPKQADLQTSSFTMSGSGSIKFDQLTSVAPLGVTYASSPAVKSNIGSVANVSPGNSYVVSSGACMAGGSVSIQASSMSGLSLTFFEDWNPSPIGVFITAC